MTVEEIDGTLEDCKEKRGELFKISGKPAVYPQIFIELEEGGAGPKFVGDWCGCVSLLLASSVMRASNMYVNTSRAWLSSTD